MLVFLASLFLVALSALNMALWASLLALASFWRSVTCELPTTFKNLNPLGYKYTSRIIYEHRECYGLQIQRVVHRSQNFMGKLMHIWEANLQTNSHEGTEFARAFRVCICATTVGTRTTIYATTANCTTPSLS